ncbi:Uncharacterized protein DAT39_005718 [Clarias magur]|uniref:Secreted protein n=1 Tax=Clarias magur TaxID=1594786 RepID=A0A8J4UC22_CLAMG|nr:Uncharacterized protein DAT39_005718 [Clarias magur]
MCAVIHNRGCLILLLVVVLNAMSSDMAPAKSVPAGCNSTKGQKHHEVHAAKLSKVLTSDGGRSRGVLE